jgi:transaldolase
VAHSTRLPSIEDTLTWCTRPRHAQRARRLVRSPRLAALKSAGTRHVYADTADVEELAVLLTADDDGALIAEVDGNTVNQPLVAVVVDRYLATPDFQRCAAVLREQAGLTPGDLPVLLYTILCGQIGHDIVHELSADRSWKVSLQLHMGLCGNPQSAKTAARRLRRMVAPAFVKVPFAPQAPDCLLVARDLEREGIPVNFTSTFSARQVVAAALLANVTRTNVFMGRLNQGLEAELLGEHVALEAQRALGALRREHGLQTELIVASVRDWETFVHAAGCDVFTAPCTVIEEFLSQDEVSPADVTTRYRTSYEQQLRVSERVSQALAGEQIARLYRVEPELIEFLEEFRASDAWRTMNDGDRLARRFDDAGFGDVFYAPSAADWDVLRRGKLPDLEAPLTRRLALDTLYSLLADADFEHHQREIDHKIAARALA